MPETIAETSAINVQEIITTVTGMFGDFSVTNVLLLVLLLVWCLLGSVCAISPESLCLL